jgi:glycosyl transferase family 25
MKSFIIHLSKIDNSLQSALQLQKDLKAINLDAELFEGTYGHDAEQLFEKENRNVHPLSFKGFPIDERYEGKAKKAGVMGCFYSHYRLWQKCVELDEPICIFEDDVRIIRPLIPIDYQDVLVIVLGGKKKERYTHLLEDPSGEPRIIEYFHLSMPGTPGYLIKPPAARKLLNEYKDTFLPSDNAINTHVVKIEIHSHLVGEANLSKKSLTKSSKFWKTFNENI